MKILIRVILILSVLEFIAFSCANPISPTGGPKDTIPPTLLESTPADQQLNYKGQTITLTFDEIINADKLKQNLIITPTTDMEYKALPKKYSITLQFAEPFEDSTTYTFNFFDGITDITEKTPAENLIIAFSTGNFIDSLSLSGNVYDRFTGEPVEKITVGLYTISDTLDFEENKPTYFSSTDESGQYFLQNIKAANYRLFAFGDENRNLIFNAATESYSVYPDTIDMRSQSGDTIDLHTIQIDASQLNFISARPTGRYFEVRYSKPIVDYSYQNSDSLFLPSKLIDENKTIRFYDNKSFLDSLFTIINVRDSLSNSTVDTVYIQYRESSRKPEQFTVSLSPKNRTAIDSDTRFSLAFNKPTTILNQDFLDVVYDTILSYDYRPKSVVFDDQRMTLSFDLPITSSSYADSLQASIDAIVLDSTNMDTTQMLLKQRLMKINPSSFKLAILPQSFVSVELDSSDLVESNYQFIKPENFGIIRLNLQTDQTHYIVQLMSKSTVAAQQSNCTECVFTKLEPGNYWVRILIDSNQNGQWDIGNYRSNRPAEPIIYFKEETTLRANFDNQLDYSF